MIPVIQNKVVIKDSNGNFVQNGNCWAASIASILELPITEVPNFEVWYDHKFRGRDVNTDSIFRDLTERFLIRHEHTIEIDNRFRVFHLSKDEWESESNIDYDIPYKSLGNYDELRELLKNEYYLITGESPRKVLHVTIWKEYKMVHDPHPTNEGIITKERFEFIRPLTKEEKELSENYYNGIKVWFPSIKNNI